MSRPPRKSSPDVVDVQVNHQELAQAGRALTEVTLADQTLMDASGLLMQIGAMGTAHMFESISTRILAETYLTAKETFKRVPYLPVRLPGGQMRKVTTLDEFCELMLGKTSRRCQQLVSNYHLLGAELYEQAEQLGLRHRDYALIKALPDDTKAAVKAAIASRDQQQVVDILEEFEARNEALKKQVADLEQTTAAKDKVIAKRDAKIAKLEEAAEAVQSEEEAQLIAVKDRVVAAQAALMQLGVLVVELDRAGASESLRQVVNNDCEYLAQTFAQILVDAGVPVQFENIVNPSWMPTAASKKAAKGG